MTNVFSHLNSKNNVPCSYPQLMEKDLNKTQTKSIPLEFETATQLLKGGGGVLGQHFCLD